MIQHAQPQDIDVIGLLDGAGIPYRAIGATEVEADVEWTGHFSFKIHTTKGLWLATDGSGRTGGPWGLRKLLRERGALGPDDGPRVWVPRYKDPETLRREWRELAESIAQKMRLVQDVWIRAHTPCVGDLKPGRAWHTEVMAAKKYLDARGFKGQPVLLSGTFRVARPNPWYDQAYIEAGCKSVVVWPMYQEDEKGHLLLVGLQRLYIDADGRKVQTPEAPARKMLGVKGVLRIKPTRRHPWSEALMVHDDRVAVGEGYESTLALCEAMGCKGIVTWDAGHLVAWAEAEAERWKDPEQKGVRPRYFVAVDRDVSETGQKAGARVCDVLQEAGLKARYLLPPGDVQGNGKSVDWADVLSEKGWGGSILAAAISGRMAGEALALAPRPKKKAGEVHEIWPVQEDENLGEAWEAPLGIPVVDARRRLDDLTGEWSWTIDWWHGQKPEERGKPPLLGIKVSTGTGKSSLIRRQIKVWETHRTVVVVRDRLRAAEYEKAGFFWRHGRADMRSDKSDGWEYPWHCPLAGRGGEVERLSEHEHTIASEVCYAAHCPHGVKRALERARARGKELTGATARFYQENRELVNSAVPCQWLDHQLDAMQKPAIVVTADGLSEGDMSFLRVAEGEDRPTLQRRVVIVDEGVEWGRVKPVSMGQITQYLKNIEGLLPGVQHEVERLEAILRDAPNKGTQQELKVRKRELEALRQASGILEQCARLVGQHPNTGGQCVDAREELREAGRALQKLIKDAGKGNAADWERPVWERWVELVDVPLRAALEIATAADLGLLSIRDGELVVEFTHPVVGQALGEVPTLILDATLDSTAEAMIKRHGGTVKSVMARQNVIVHIDPRRYNGAIPSHDKKRLRAEAERILAFVEEKKKEVNGRVVALTQKRKALTVLEILKEREGPEALKEFEALLQRVENDNPGAREALWDEINRYGVGWWGWCEEAHDAWSGSHLVIWDDKGLPREAIRDLWEVHRHLKVREGGGDVADLPHYPSPQDATAFEQGAWVRVGPYRQQSRCTLPKDPAIREWELAIHDDFVEQAIGRLRGTNHKEDAEPLHVWITGGRPHPRLFEMGLREVRFEKILEAETALERGCRVHNERLQDAVLAGLILEYKGVRATRRAIEAASRVPSIWRDVLVPHLKGNLYRCGTMPEGRGVRSETALEAARVVSAVMEKLDIVAPTDIDKQGAWDDAAADLMASALDVMRIPITGGRGSRVIEAVKEVSAKWPIYPEKWDDDKHALVPSRRFEAGRRLMWAVFAQAKMLAEEAGDDPALWYTRERLEKAIEDVLHSNVKDIRDPLYVGPVPEDVKEAVVKWLRMVAREADRLAWSLRPRRRRRLE